MGVFAMPSLGSDMERGRLVEWLVKPGDSVARGDVVAVVETQKGAIEIETFEEGTVHALVADLGADLPVGAPLAVILGAGEAPPAATPAAPGPAPETAPASEVERGPEPEAATATAGAATLPMRPAAPPAAPPPAAPRPAAPSGQVAASPAARARAAALGIDLATLSGSGPGGVVVLADVEAHAAAPAPSATPARGTPMEEMRKAIAAAMTRSKQTIPHFSLSQTMDVQPAMDFLARRNDGRPPSERLLLGALFVRAAAHAAAEVGALNGHYEDGAFRPSNTVNPGVAVALRGGGLVAPAIRDALSLDLDGTMAAMRDIVSRARAGRLRNSEMTQGTITVSALGDSGAEAMTGVIFPPQVALVGLGAPQTRPWVADGQVVPRPVVTLTVAADHRVADGRQVARFIAAFEALLTDPEAP